MTRRIINDTLIGMNEASAKKARDMTLFFSAGIMISSMSLPIVLARSPSENPVVSTSYLFMLETLNHCCKH